MLNCISLSQIFVSLEDTPGKMPQGSCGRTAAAHHAWPTTARSRWAAGARWKPRVGSGQCPLRNTMTTADPRPKPRAAYSI